MMPYDAKLLNQEDTQRTKNVSMEREHVLLSCLQHMPMKKIQNVQILKWWKRIHQMKAVKYYSFEEVISAHQSALTYTDIHHVQSWCNKHTQACPSQMETSWKRWKNMNHVHVTPKLEDQIVYLYYSTSSFVSQQIYRSLSNQGQRFGTRN